MLNRCLLLLVLALSLPLTGWGQAGAIPPVFTPLLQRLKQAPFSNAFGKPITFSSSGVYRDSIYGPGDRWKLNFELSLANKPLALQSRVVKLPGHGYPVSYSVVFQNCLVALFKDGKFGCYRLPGLTPDEQLARWLNAGSWQRFWLLEGKLVAQNAQGTAAYDARTRAWQPYSQPVPFGQRPKLYEDERFLVYATCNMDFGMAGLGTVFFYKKATGQTFRSYATCPTGLWQAGSQYRLLWSNNGFSGCQLITNPEIFSQVAGPRTEPRSLVSKPPPADSAALGYQALQLLGGFRREAQQLYLVRWHSTTFLATITGPRITIVDPLFSNDIFADNPVTTTYSPALTLTNLGDNQLSEGSERAALLWQGQQLTRIEWSE